MVQDITMTLIPILLPMFSLTMMDHLVKTRMKQLLSVADILEMEPMDMK